jgi:hypothetical protein
MGTGAVSPGVKRPWHEADQSTPTSAKFKKVWIYTCTPPYAFMAQYIVKHKDNLTFTFYEDKYTQPPHYVFAVYFLNIIHKY